MQVKETINILVADSGRHKEPTGYGHVSRFLSLALSRDERFKVCFLHSHKSWSYEGCDIEELKSIPESDNDNDCDIVLQIGNPLTFKKNLFNKPSIFFTLCDLSDLTDQSIEAIKDAEAIMTASKSSYKILKRYVDNVYLTPLPVSSEKFKPIPRYRQEGSECFSFIFVGSFSFRKGVDLLIEAFMQEFSSNEVNLHLHCPGANSDALYNYLLEVSKKHNKPGLFSVTTNNLSLAWLNRIYNRSDAFVSLTRGEGWGLPIVEAMLCGLPVIAPLSTSMCSYLTEDVAFCLPVNKKLATQITEEFGQNFKNNYGKTEKVGYYEVDLDIAKKTLRNVFSEQEKAKAVGELGREYILQNFSFDKVKHHVSNAIIDFIQKRINAGEAEKKLSANLLNLDKNTSKKLDIGSGSKPRSGYMRHDIRPLEGIDIVCDAKKFPEEYYDSFDEVFASNVLEHFNRFEVKHVLKEWTKLVRKGGIIDIVVPDVREICRQFVDEKIDIGFFSYVMFGGNDYEFNIHKYGFDIALLQEWLQELGFEIIKSTSGPRWEDRKQDRYCPMVRIVAKKTS